MEFKRDPRFGRMIPAMVTPFDADRELDLDRAQELADRLVRGGSRRPYRQRHHRREPHGVLSPEDGAVPRRGGARWTAACPSSPNVGDNCTADTV